MNKLYSCADWMEVDGLLPAVCTVRDRQADAYSASIKSFTWQSTFPTASSESTTARRSQLTPVEQRVSLQKSIEEFNAIIDADMGLTSSSSSVVAPVDHSEPEGAQTKLLGAFMLKQFSSSAPVQEIKYGWSPFDEGEFQFAVHDDPTV